LLDANHRSVGSTDADAGSNGEVSM
jgi:hypothetical protein